MTNIGHLTTAPLSELTYAEVGLLHAATGAELERRNLSAHIAPGEDGGGW